MTKGGARKPTCDFPVGRGMGLERLHQLLKLIEEFEFIGVTKAQIEMNKRFALWDDPKEGGRTETCRACFKELWRLGLIEKVIPLNKGSSVSITQWLPETSINIRSVKVVPLKKETWRGEKNEGFRVSHLGSHVLGKMKGLFPFYIAWCVINAAKNGFFPQVENLLKLYEINGNIPVNDNQVKSLTKKYNIYVDYHGSKTLKFGFLEPSGLIYRSSNESFSVNLEFIKKLVNISYEDLFSNISQISILIDDLEITLKDNNLGRTSFGNGVQFEFEIEVVNKSSKKKKLILESFLYSLLSEISTLNHDKSIIINAREKKIINFELISKATKLSDSLMATCIGFVEFTLDGEFGKLFLPQIEIMAEDHIWELELIDLFNKLELQAFHLTGKSDRPDGVIDLYEINRQPPRLLKYLRDDSKAKLLMETTLGEYNGSKLIADTIKKNTRGYNKFETHTKFVLKIAASGQIIAADTFASNISSNFNRVKNEAKHKVTLIDKENLSYLVNKYQSNQNKDAVKKLLKSGKIITRKLIDTTF